MVVTFLALIYMKMAQPALIYLVPCTLIPTHVVAAFRKQWLVMWKGHYVNALTVVSQLTFKKGEGNGEKG